MEGAKKEARCAMRESLNFNFYIDSNGFDSLPHLSVILGHVVPPLKEIAFTERQKRILRERSLNLDALNVVNLLLRSVVAPVSQILKRGEWVNENVFGGKLLNYEMMFTAVETKAAAKAKNC
ncbi:uncharacterized protein PITG_11382 [Phytophthora infestans T30-4]|uniref:Uncharacterized protein n=1 Tax=Phytophthora infestans (strain T30-4) TaxID=403677 RepID=D0NIN4_PHYIT|nr:uncharacterized protein PITG_11382 [Phytophthora infestans T30-4]EEY59368.1 conserved hypothetical protein [Phytophthora infestans T30-4]|eukprot:XP_002900978.1 conserved hypothetical protein [Phytophthora infestans T30-4]